MCGLIKCSQYLHESVGRKMLENLAKCLRLYRSSWVDNLILVEKKQNSLDDYSHLLSTTIPLVNIEIILYLCQIDCLKDLFQRFLKIRIKSLVGFVSELLMMKQRKQKFLFICTLFFKNQENWREAKCSYFSEVSQPLNVLILFSFQMSIITILSTCAYSKWFPRVFVYSETHSIVEIYDSWLNIYKLLCSQKFLQERIITII